MDSSDMDSSDMDSSDMDSSDMDSSDMDSSNIAKLARIFAIVAEVAALETKTIAMHTKNEQRKVNGESPAYGEKAFLTIHNMLEDLANTLWKMAQGE